MSKRFHVIPEFVQTDRFLIGASITSIDFRVESSDGNFVALQNKLRIRKSYPNKDYFVAGSKETKVGWISDVPDGVNNFKLRFFWTIGLGLDDKEFMFVQNINVDISNGSSGLYSMNPMTWDVPESPMNSRVQCVGHASDISSYRKNRPNFKVLPLFDEEMSLSGMVINESIEIAPAVLDDKYLTEEWLTQLG